MPALTRKDIVSAEKLLQITKLPIPGWGQGKWRYIRMISAEEADLVQRLCFEQAKNKNPDGRSARVMAGWCVLGICDKQGKRLFGEADIDIFAKGPLIPLQRASLAIMDLNGITGDDEAAKKN